MANVKSQIYGTWDGGDEILTFFELQRRNRFNCSTFLVGFYRPFNIRSYFDCSF